MRRAIQAVDCLPKRLRIVALPDRRQRAGMSRCSRRPIPVSGRFGAQPAARPHLPAPSSPASCIFRAPMVQREAASHSETGERCKRRIFARQSLRTVLAKVRRADKEMHVLRAARTAAGNVQESDPPSEARPGDAGASGGRLNRGVSSCCPRARRGMSDGRARGGRPVRPAVQMRPLMQVRSPMQAQLPTGCSYKSVRLHIECGYSIMSSSGSITFRPR